MIKIISTDGKINIYSPYSEKFVTAIKLAGARWSGEAWALDARDIELARSICMDIYGCDDRPHPTCSVRVTAKEVFWKAKGAVTLFNRVVAKAWGRDSGAKVGEGVVFVKGQPTSSGSVKNWATEIPENCEFIMRDIPLRAVENKIDCPAECSLSIEEIKMPKEPIDNNKKASLISRKAELLTELESIDRELELLAETAENELQDND